MRLPYGLTPLLLVQIDRSSDPTHSRGGDLARTRVVKSKSPDKRDLTQTIGDEFDLEALQQQYYNQQCRVTPTHRPPAETVTEIFHICHPSLRNVNYDPLDGYKFVNGHTWVSP